jgi:hypothetical protein
MAWAGVGGGGNTHDTCVSAVASLVARGWTDTQIHERIEFATREACGRAQLEYDGPGSARAIQEWIHSARKKVWLGECCEPTTNPKDYASNDALWNAYNAWALRHGGSETSRHTSIITWGKAMTRLGYPAVNARRGHEYVKARKLMLKRHPSTRDGEPGY